MSDNIKVVVKVRPLISREIEDKLSYQWRVKNDTLYQLDQNGKDLGQSFTFDKVYDKDTETSDVYDDIAKPIVEAATAGFNGTIFAYGQTSSGKTYTMTGTDKSPGIIPLAVVNLFEIIRNVPDRDFLVRVSYIEIYNETVKDLLNIDKDNIKIHETLQGIKVDATEKVTSSPEEVLEVMKEGEANRQKGATNMNEQSSRSHSIFQIIIESREHIEGEENPGCVNVSQLNLVDLAGSERSGQTGATGIRFKEGTHINKSLSALALVIKQLSEDPNKYTNYRDSKLTRILQNSLGGNAKTSIICAITPAAVEETISTLQFANRAKAIKNKPEVNAVATADSTMIQRLTKQMCQLQAQLERKKNLEQDNYKLQSKIQSLQKLILNGFAHRHSVDLIGPRRKLQQPRRITISTLHSIPDDEHIAPIPKFCTPSLKYNPALVKPDFLPAASDCHKLPAVPEEAPRLITPPPIRTVFFSNEVIELDSDDEDSTQDDAQTCSPVHKCYAATKTPPCVLRRNAKEAEKNLKGIMELTEREKMYAPSVVEYIEKLEHNTTVIAKLQDQIDLMSKQSKEKDLEVEHLKSKIKQAEEAIKSLTSNKTDLQSKCDNYNTRLTDAEVSYETLRKKAKLREEELLSLLEELNGKNKKNEDIGTVMSRTLDKEIHFMDISKDISLVNSDNESIINTNDDESDNNNLNELLANTQSELNLKNQTIIDLEANIFAQQQTISLLEERSQSLQEEVTAFNEKLSLMDDENSLLKATIETLNSTIKDQKENLETAIIDIDNYNSLIQELQIKITQKESLPTIALGDSMLENMIANEEKFIASNENMRNIIHSLKLALETRNKEINELRTSMQMNTDLTHENKTLEETLESKTKEVDSLNKQITENITSINKLMHEKSVLQTLEQELTEKLVTSEQKANELEQLNREIATSAENLKEENDKLKVSIAENELTEKDLSEINNKLLKEIENMTDKIAALETEISEKDDLISSLKEEDRESNENLINAKAAVFKSQLILNTLSGNIQEVPEMIDNFVNVFNILSNSLNTLENVANSVVKEKEDTEKKTNDLKIMLEVLTLKHTTEISTLQEQIDIIRTTESSRTQEIETLTQTINQLNNELEITRNDLHSKNSDNENLEAALVKATEHIETCNTTIAQLIEQKNELENLTMTLEERERLLEDKISEFSIIKEQVNNSIQERDEILSSIFKEITEFTTKYNIQNDTRGEEDNDCNKIYERILLTLDKIGSHITFITSKNGDEEDELIKVNEVLLEAKREIVELTQQNLSLVEQLSDVESKYNELTNKLTKNQNYNKELNKELSMTQRVVENLQEEVQLKADELTSLEEKLKDLKDQFQSNDFIMKQQIDELKLENKQLKASIPSVRNKTDLGSIITYEHKDPYDVDNKDVVNSERNSNEITTTCSDLASPPSLLTICCNKIVDYIQPKDVESNTTTVISNEYSEHQNYIVECKCSELSIELQAAREENYKIVELLEQLEAVNQCLMQEQEETRNELQLLTAHAHDLQKKIINHKTNLAILTATTTAENRVLKSQVKALQHHHSRFHNVCQRDIPDVKKQLRELMTLLRGDLSIVDQQNASFKRYSLPDVLDSSTALPNFKNESTLDGDLLMLDTNITMTTAADNTLTAQDQTCLDLTQFYTEASCQPNEFNQIEILSEENNVYERLNMLKEENVKLREIVDKYAEIKNSMIDAQLSPIKISNGDYENINAVPNSDKISAVNECEKCNKQQELQHIHEKLCDDVKLLSEELFEIKSQKAEIEQKYNGLILETPSTDLLVKKLNNLEKDYNIKIQEISKLNNTLSIKAEQIKILQEENDTLSTQVMENISEADDLNKELDIMKKINAELLDKCSKLEQSDTEISDKKFSDMSDSCSECLSKDDLIKSLELRLTKTHTKLNRSLSDSDTSSRYNKICTLQSELDAGREDCKEITEDVVTIKNHLDRSNLAMELDDSMGESNEYTFTRDYSINSPQSNNCYMPDIPEEHPIDIYKIDKLDCFNYYSEKTGVDNETINRDIKMIDLMKSFYDHLIIKHGNEVENLTNKLKDYDEAKNQLETQISNLKEKYSQVTAELEQKDRNNSAFVKGLSQIKNNINILNQEIIRLTDADVTKLVNMCKENFFKVLDNELGLSSTRIIETLIDNIVNKHQTDLTGIMEKYSKLQEHMENITKELSSVTTNLENMKSQLSAKEEEYNLLKKQKERIHEISNAVTLDIVKKDKELTDTISNGYRKLVELNVVNNQDVDLTLPVIANIELLFERCIAQHKNVSSLDAQKDKENLAIEVMNTKQIIEEKQKEIEELKSRCQNLQEINNAVTVDLLDKDNKLHAQSALYKDLNEIYESKVKENKANVDLIENLSEEVNLLKVTINEKEKTISKLEMEIHDSENKLKELTEIVGSVKLMQDDIAHLKAANEAIIKEKESYANELIKSGETLKQNNIEMDKMTSDILVLRESVRENGMVIENLNVEAKILLKQNMELKQQLEEKCRECYRLETNIKTHEKSAEVQTRMIMRLEKQKNEDDKIISEKTKQIEELKQKGSLQTDGNEIELLRKAKETLEVRVTELEELLSGKSRPSIDALADLSRRRRQSLHDSKRLFGEDKLEFGDHNGMEAVFESRPKPDDLFMDVDEDMSNRSSPIMRHSKGRDSLSTSKTDQDEEQPSRPSSVVATRRRRQSIHDLHRSVLRHTPSPDLPNRILDEFNHSKPSDTSGDIVSEVSHLRERLACCQQELDDLKEKYRELDEECETCAEYLRERDEQCARLKKERAALQATVSDLKEKLQSCNPNQSQQAASKPSVAHVGVNTDEDWSNLHSVVVDRMSFDAEVEKNKKLTKTIEELRFRKQDLKNTLAKMQKALEKNSSRRELDAAKHELQACKQELSQLRVKYKELDEECETCAQYLREKEEQCRRLKEAKTALESQLLEFQGDHNSKSQSTRKKRQSLHDQNRSASVDVKDACTETCDDLLSYQVERDGSVRLMSEDKQAKEMKHLKLVVEKLSQQKSFLEQQLVNVSAMQPPHPMYVATGSAIVQNQQLTDVMKENQKLKKINAKLVNICKKRGKDSNRENEDPAERG
ncbi:hypothetical protein PYW07_015804 [Mythimna separata]|uniref:Kinesin motor domain-containing protein n=1 Tax=Mythimna separata TaxID=271217 RepID=A0AAD7YS34_MYTSE|nr:hypothetical protein PYW07_015804 [Mythimna separata]